MTVVTPFVRPLHGGPPLERGKDVTAIQRALRLEGSLTKPVTSSAYAENTWDAVDRFRRKRGMLPGEDYNRTTHTALAPFFDAYGRWLLTEAANDLRPDPRALVRDTALWYYGQRNQIRYSQTRPIPTVSQGIRPPAIPRVLDCSGLAITCYWVHGLHPHLGDENAHGWGNTWSLYRHGRPVSLDSLRPADFVFYYSSCSHVAIYVGDGRVVSNGHHPMGLYTVRYASIYGARSYLP